MKTFETSLKPKEPFEMFLESQELENLKQQNIEKKTGNVFLRFFYKVKRNMNDCLVKVVSTKEGTEQLCISQSLFTFSVLQ